MPNERDFQPADGEKARNLQVAVTWPVVAAAVYIVIVGIGIPVATNFFPESIVGRSFRGEGGGVMWWCAILIPPLVFASIVDRVRQRNRR